MEPHTDESSHEKTVTAQFYKVNDIFKQNMMHVECPVCNKSYRSESVLLLHFKLHQPGFQRQKKSKAKVNETAKKFQCECCDKKFERKRNLTRHIKNHEIVSYCCPGCKKEFKDNQSLYKHKKRCLAFKEICAQKAEPDESNKIGTKKRWIETTDTYKSVYQHKCQMCDARFALREHLDSHTAHCGDLVWPQEKSLSLEFLKESLRKAIVDRKRRHTFAKMLEKDKRKKQEKGRKRVRSRKITRDKIKRLQKLIFHPSTSRDVARTVLWKYRLLQKLFVKNLDETREHFRILRKKVSRKLYRCDHILQKKSWYKCIFCGTGGSAVKMVTHLTLAHKICGPVGCSCCTKRFNTIQAFRFHQALHFHKLHKAAFIIKYTKFVPVDNCIDLTSIIKGDVSASTSDNKGGTEGRIETTYELSEQYQEKCLCGLVVGNIKELENHVQKVHKMILMFKCKHCLSKNMFMNLAVLYTHIEYKHNKRQINKTDFEVKFLLPVANSDAKVTVSTTSEEQHTVPVSADKKDKAKIMDVLMHQDDSIQMSESELIQKQKEFVSLALGQFPDKIGEKLSVKETAAENKVHQRQVYNLTQKRSYPQGKATQAEGPSVAKRKKIDYDKLNENWQETSSKLTAKQIIRKYKTISGWKSKKTIHLKKRRPTKVKRKRRVPRSKLELNNHCIYKCTLCKGYQNNSVQKIINHLSRAHTKIAILECSLCQKHFCSLRDMSAHQFLHLNSKTEIETNILYTSIVNPIISTSAPSKKNAASTEKKKSMQRITRGYRPIRPKYNPAFEYDKEAVFLNKLQKQDQSFSSQSKMPDKNIALTMPLALKQPNKPAAPGFLPSQRTQFVSPGVSSMPNPVILRVRDRSGKDITFLVKTEPAEDTDEINNLSKEHECSFCGKQFKLNIMLNQHIKKEHPTENLTDQSNEILKNKVLNENLKANTDSSLSLKEAKVELEDISVSTDGKTMFMHSLNQSKKPENKKGKTRKKPNLKSPDKQKLSKTNMDQKLSKTNMDQNDHNYVTKTDGKETGQEAVWQCSKCNYKAEKEVNLKRHVTAKHTRNVEQQNSLTKKENTMSSENFKNEEDIYSGDSDQSYLDDVDNDKDYKVELEYSSESEEEKQEQLRQNRKRIGKVQKPVKIVCCSNCGYTGSDKSLKSHNCCLELYTYYCPFCDNKRGSFVYEEIRDHIDKEHMETAVRQSTENSHCGLKKETSLVNNTAEAQDGDQMVVTIDNTPQESDESNQGTKTELLAICKEEPTSNDEETSTDGVVAQRFECGFCSLTFKREFTRNIHKLDHTGQTLCPHVCGLCGFSYRGKSHLFVHMKVHRLQGKFKCKQCSRQFKTQIDLDRHVPFHADIKNFKCGLCGERFTRVHGVKRHMDRKHGNLSESEKSRLLLKINDQSKPGDNGRNPTAINNKAYECSVCHIGYSALKAARRHAQKKHLDLTKSERNEIIKRKASEEPTREKSDMKEEDSRNIAESQENTEQFSGRRQSQGDASRIQKETSDLERHTTSAVSPRLKKASSKNKPFVCSVCGTKFSDLHAGRRHAKDRHTNLSEAERNRAIKRTAEYENTAMKIGESASKEGNDNNFGEITSWHCEECAYSSARLVNLRKHVQTMHQVKPEPITMETLDSEVQDNTGVADAEETSEKKEVNFIDTEELKIKTEIHDSDSDVKKTAKPKTASGEDSLNALYKCTLNGCGQIFRSQKLLSLHRKKDHGTGLVFSCSSCNNEYARVTSLRIHLYQSHSTLGRLPLNILDTEILQSHTNRRGRLQQVDDSLVQEVLMCVSCGVLGTNPMLDTHICQPKVPAFYCPLCEKTKEVFSENMEAIREHIRRKHGLDDSKDQNSSETSTGNLAVEAELLVAQRQAELPSAGEQQQQSSKEATSKCLCVHCNTLFPSEFEKNMHELEHPGVVLLKFVCGLCGASYPRKSAYNKHALSHKEYKYKCEQCDRAFQAKSDLDRHINLHTGERPSQCDVCGNRYCDEKECKRHMKKKHPEVYYERYAFSLWKPAGAALQSYICDQCGEIFNNTRQWNFHNIMAHGHRKRNLFCSKCPDRIFRTKKMLDKHIHKHKHGEMAKKKQSKMSKVQPLESVKVAVTDTESLKEVYHRMRVINRNDKDGCPNMCGICSKKFRKVKSLNLHIRVRHIEDKNKRFKCSECGRGFVLMHSFRNHMRTHTNSRPYKCRLCGKGYKQRAHIRDHLLTHSSKSVIDCKICGKLFRSMGSRSSHILNHCMIKPFACPLCPLKFADVGQLTDHFSNINHSEPEEQDMHKVYTCPMCLKFQCEKKADMTRHFDYHTMEKQFHCKVCNEKFIRYLDLYFHKEKLKHFVESDFEGVKRRINTCLYNNRCGSETFDNYSLEELQTLFVYQPDNKELSKPELEDMQNPDGISEYATEIRHERKTEMKRYKIPFIKGSSGINEDVRYEESYSSDELDENTDVEYEEDLMTAAEQLTHMADMNQAVYPEVVISSSGGSKASELFRNHSETPLVSVETDQDIYSVADQIEIDGSFNLDSPWNTDLLVKTPSQKSFLYQGESGKYNSSNNSTVIQTPCYSKKYEETVSATNALLQLNCSQSGLANINAHQPGDNIEENVVKSSIEHVPPAGRIHVQQTQQNTQTLSSLRSVIKQTYSVVDQSGIEMLVCVLDETAQDNDILDMVDNNKSQTTSVVSRDIISGVGEIDLNTGLNITVSDSNGIAETCDIAERDAQTDENIARKAITNMNSATGGEQTGNMSVYSPNYIAERIAQTNTNSDGKTTISVTPIQSQRTTVEEQVSSLGLIHELKSSNNVCPSVPHGADQTLKQVLGLKEEAAKEAISHPYTGDDPADEEEEKGGISRIRRTRFFYKSNENTGAYPCDICGKRFGKAKLRNVHAKIHLPDHLQKFPCPQCGKGFSRRRALDLHMVVHTGAKDWKCDICERCFTQKGHLRNHKLTHSENRPFKCSLCSWSAITMSKLRLHVQTKHNENQSGEQFENEKPWKCQICDKTFSGYSALKRHNITHLSTAAREKIVARTSAIIPEDQLKTTAEETESQSSNATVTNEKKSMFMCDVCGAVLSTSWTLSLHKQAKHAVGGDYKCDKCDKTFPSKYMLKLHISYHGEPMPCEKCGKILKSKSGLRKHLAVIHSEKKMKYAYECLRCKKGFYKQGDFLCHVAVCCPTKAGFKFVPVTPTEEASVSGLNQ